MYTIQAETAPSTAPTAVGILWLAVPAWKPPLAFVYDLLIYEPYRRRGYTTQGLLPPDHKVKALGLNTIGLHVFGHNHGARAL